MASDEFEDLAKFLSFLKENYPNSQFSESISENTGLDENNVKAIIENAILNRWVDVEVRTRAGPLIKINRDGNNKLNRLMDKEDSLPSENITNINVSGENINIGTGNTIARGTDESPPTSTNWTKWGTIFGGIIVILMVVSILMLQPMNPNSDDVINTDISGDRNIVIIGDGNTITSGNTEQSEFVRINPETSALLLELQQEIILEQEQRIKYLEKSLADITDENERMRLEPVIDRLKLANNLMQEQDFVGAETHYRLILSNNEIDLEALKGLSLALARQDKFEESIFYYNKVLALEPDSYEAIINNAWSFAMLEEYEQSLKMLNDLEIKDPDDLLVLAHKCWVLHKLDLHESAVETCKKVLAPGGTDDVRVAKAYSLSLSFLNRFEDSLPFHKKLYELYPNDFPTLVNYANTLSNVGQVQNALIIYDEGLEKFPNSAVLQHNKKVLCVKNPHLDCSPS